MLTELQARVGFRMATYKMLLARTKQMQANNITIAVTLEFVHLYYKAVTKETRYMENTKYFFSLAKPSQNQ